MLTRYVIPVLVAALVLLPGLSALRTDCGSCGERRSNARLGLSLGACEGGGTPARGCCCCGCCATGDEESVPEDHPDGPDEPLPCPGCDCLLCGVIAAIPAVILDGDALAFAPARAEDLAERASGLTPRLVGNDLLRPPQA